jgi:hypothetical protein
LYKVQHHSYLGKVNCAMGPSSLKNWGVKMYCIGASAESFQQFRSLPSLVAAFSCKNVNIGYLSCLGGICVCFEIRELLYFSFPCQPLRFGDLGGVNYLAQMRR